MYRTPSILLCAALLAAAGPSAAQKTEGAGSAAAGPGGPDARPGLRQA